MPATTAKGYPYPLGTDRVMDGDDSIKSLAEACDANSGQGAAGSVSVPIANGASSGAAAVTFPVGRFTVAPFVTISINGSLNTGWLAWSVSGITTSGCTVQVAHRDATASASATAFTVGWIARN